jgi:hypothetical protein
LRQFLSFGRQQWPNLSGEELLFCFVVKQIDPRLSNSEQQNPVDLIEAAQRSETSGRHPE